MEALFIAKRKVFAKNILEIDLIIDLQSKFRNINIEKNSS